MTYDFTIFLVGMMMSDNILATF